jgi:hypothetical protein
MDDFGGFRWRLMHGIAVCAGLLTGLLSLAYAMILITLAGMHQVYGWSSGPYTPGWAPAYGGTFFGELQVPALLFVGALSFALTAHVTRGSKQQSEAKQSELHGLLILVRELEDKVERLSEKPFSASARDLGTLAK